MAWAPYVIMAIGTVISAQAKLQEGEAKKQAADFEAKQLRRAALERRATAQRQAQEVKRQGELQQSRALAVAAASGASTSDFGFEKYLSDLAGESHYRQMVALYEGETEAQGLREQAYLTKYAGKQAKKASRLAAASTVLKGASSMYSMYGGGGPPSGGSYGFSGGTT